jgi:hypothetical protein
VNIANVNSAGVILQPPLSLAFLVGGAIATVGDVTNERGVSILGLARQKSGLKRRFDSETATSFRVHAICFFDCGTTKQNRTRDETNFRATTSRGNIGNLICRRFFWTPAAINETGP